MIQQTTSPAAVQLVQVQAGAGTGHALGRAQKRQNPNTHEKEDKMD